MYTSQLATLSQLLPEFPKAKIIHVWLRCVVEYQVLANWLASYIGSSIIDDGDGVSTSSVGGKSEVRAVLVQGIDK